MWPNEEMLASVNEAPKAGADASVELHAYCTLDML